MALTMVGTGNNARVPADPQQAGGRLPADPVRAGLGPHGVLSPNPATAEAQAPSITMDPT
jgi:hypothetical protein